MEDTGNIKVVCRFRPMNEKEVSRSENICVSFISDTTVSINPSHEGLEPAKFNFDRVFRPDCAQSEVYEVSARPIVEAVMQGFNGTVFAYGQTSSGKTFTMTGPDFEDEDLMGIIPRMVRTVFDMISSADESLEFSVKVAYCEIYLEKIKDLLDTSKVNLKVHEDRTRGVYIEGLSDQYVSDDKEVYELMKLGLNNREVAYTNMNSVSSRSHSIFLITISQTNSKDYSGKVGKLYLVDLAGSEKVGKTGATGIRLDEAKNINKSLTALGQVINSLTDGKSTHVPYRDSKLTRVLQDSLGGNSKTSLIVTCSPSPYNEAETVSSLRFGIRAKAIKNKPKINREYTLAELKLLLTKTQEELEKRDRIINKLEESLKNNGGNPADLNFSFRVSEGQGKFFNYDEISAEIQELRNSVEEEVKKNKSLAEKNKNLNKDVGILQEENLKLKEILKLELENKQNLENQVKEQENLIEKHVFTKESLESKIESLKIKFDLVVKENEVKISQLKQEIALGSNSPSKKTPESSHQLLITQLEEEKLLSATLQEKINDLENTINEILVQNLPETHRSEQYIQNIIRKNKEQWEQEKKYLMRDLANRIDKVINLELEIDNIKDMYRILEFSLKDGEKNLMKRNIALEKNFESLIKEINKLSLENDRLTLELLYIQKKYNDDNEKIKEIEKENKELKGKLEVSKENLKQLEAEIDCANSRSRQSINGNIKKQIKGGANPMRNSIIMSKIPKIPS